MGKALEGGVLQPLARVGNDSRRLDHVGQPGGGGPNGKGGYRHNHEIRPCRAGDVGGQPDGRRHRHAGQQLFMLVVPPDGRHLFLERGPQGHRVAVLMSHDGQGGAPASSADDCDVCHKPNRLSDESEPPIVRTAFVSLYHKAARNAALLSPERLCPFRSGSMVSQPSEILDFRLRREVIIPQKQAQANDVYRYESAPRCRTVYAGYYSPFRKQSKRTTRKAPLSRFPGRFRFISCRRTACFPSPWRSA